MLFWVDLWKKTANIERNLKTKRIDNYYRHSNKRYLARTLQIAYGFLINRERARNSAHQTTIGP